MYAAEYTRIPLLGKNGPHGIPNEETGRADIRVRPLRPKDAGATLFSPGISWRMQIEI